MLITSYLALFHPLVSSPQQILDHMNESAVYNESDLAPFTRRLEQLRNIIKHDAESGKHPVAMTKLLERQLGECGGYITFSSVTPIIVPLRSRRRRFRGCVPVPTPVIMPYPLGLILKYISRLTLLTSTFACALFIAAGACPTKPDWPSESILRSLQDSLAVLSVELIPIHERLVNIRRKLVALAAKEGSHKAELKPLQDELRKIDSLSISFSVSWP